VEGIHADRDDKQQARLGEQQHGTIFRRPGALFSGRKIFRVFGDLERERVR
jgi:hypothetical protein